MGSYCLMGTEFQFYKMKRHWGADGGDGLTTMWMYSVLLTVHLKCLRWWVRCSVYFTKILKIEIIIPRQLLMTEWMHFVDVCKSCPPKVLLLLSCRNSLIRLLKIDLLMLLCGESITYKLVQLLMWSFVLTWGKLWCSSQTFRDLIMQQNILNPSHSKLAGLLLIYPLK